LPATRRAATPVTLPGVRERLLVLGTAPNPTTVEEAGVFYASELTRWTKVVVRAGLKGTE
jgi:hypothetical protein